MTQALPVTRRALLSLRFAGAGANGCASGAAADIAPDPFSSYEAAYAQVNEARPFLAEEARRLGIPTENRSDLDILKEIYAKADPPSG
jgi:hypothetical protein